MSVLTAGAGTGPLVAALASVAISLADDVAFAALDMATGYKSFEESATNLGKTALTSVATSALSFGIGAASQALDSAMTFGSTIGGQMLEVGTDVLLTGAQTAVNSYGGAFINSINFDQIGRDSWFDTDKFNQATENGFASGMVSSMAGALVGSTLETGTFGFVGDMVKDTQQFNSMMSGLTSTAVTFAYTGNAKLNVLNLGMFKLKTENGELIRTGLLEVNFGRSGFSAQIGTGGMDMSPGALRNFVSGANAYGNLMNTNRQIRNAGVKNRFKAAVRALSSSGQSETDQLYQDILSGRAQLDYDRSMQGYAQTVMGDDGKKTITLSREGSRNGLQMAVTMAHEAYRDGVFNGQYGQNQETRNAVKGHMDTADQVAALYGMGSLNRRMRGEVKLFRVAEAYGPGDELLDDYADGNYDSGGDYWWLKKVGDGKYNIEYDGSTHLYDENGHLIALDETGEFDESLAKYMGINLEEARKLMNEDSGGGMSFRVTDERGRAMDTYFSALDAYVERNNFYSDENIKKYFGNAPDYVIDAFKRSAQEQQERIEEDFRNVWNIEPKAMQSPLLILDDEVWPVVTGGYEYSNGEKHRTTNDQPAIDLRSNWKSSSIYTMGWETFVKPHWQYPDNKDKDYGFRTISDTGRSQRLFAHLMYDTTITNHFTYLFNLGDDAGFNRVTLPPFTNFGMTGKTGNSETIHLHYEIGNHWKERFGR